MRKGLQDLLNAFKRLGIGKPVTIDQLRKELKLAEGKQKELSRRIRDLRAQGYQIPDWDPKTKTYTLLAADPDLTDKADTEPIPGKLRAEILLACAHRCGMCGKTVQEDHIKLDVDHRIPRTWGGATERDNLWALCKLCNIQKKDFYATLDPEIMKKCMKYPLTVQRLGELLKAFKGEVVPRYLLEIVGQDYEWPRRLRELRDIGWDVERIVDTSQKGRHQHTYKLNKSAPWPADIRAAIKAAAKKRKREAEED